MKTRAASKVDFAATTRDLMDQQGLGLRGLAKLTDRAGHKYGVSRLSQLVRGDMPPTPENMEIIAKALQVKPTIYREYRQHVAAAEAAKLAGEIELDKVLGALKSLNGNG